MLRINCSSIRRSFLTLLATSLLFTSAAIADECLSVDSFSPPSGRPGDRVDIYGGCLHDAVSVNFNGTAAQFERTNDIRHIIATVPSSATSGPITVAHGTGSATSAEDFTIYAVSPVPPKYLKGAFVPNPGGILLEWVNRAGSQAKFDVYRTKYSPFGGFQTLQLLGRIRGTAFADATTRAGITYSYEVQTVIESPNGDAYSDTRSRVVVTASTGPQVPFDLKVRGTGPDFIALTFRLSPGSQTVARVYRKMEGEAEFKLHAFKDLAASLYSGDVYRISDRKNIIPGRSYIYQLRTDSADATWSPLSEAIWATAGAAQ